MAAAVADPDPVLYYEHIALYRDPRIKQALADARAGADADRQGRAAPRRRRPRDHLVRRLRARRAARRRDGWPPTASRPACSTCASLAPLDRDAVLAVARHCSRVLIVHEDSRTGGIGESLAAIIQEEAFESLDAPVRIIGALDTPVPYSPPLEEFFLVSDAEIDEAIGGSWSTKVRGVRRVRQVRVLRGSTGSQLGASRLGFTNSGA